MTELTRKIHFRPAYDKVAEGYGIHNMEISFVLKGPAGAVDFVIHTTGWYTKSARERNRGLPLSPYESPWAERPWMISINYHSRVKQYEDQTPIHGCDYLDGADCYCDGTSLADETMEKFVAEGEEAVWKELEEWYETRLKDSFAPEI